VGDPTFDDGHVPSLLGICLLLSDCMALLCEGGLFGGCGPGSATDLRPQDKEDLDVKEMDVKRVYLTIWDICKLKRKCQRWIHLH